PAGRPPSNRIGPHPGGVQESTARGAFVAVAADPQILVTLATYKERENLAPLVKEVHSVVPAADVLVIDDNSPDGTGALADELAAADPRVHVLHRACKLALGTGIPAGMRTRMA